MDTSPFIYLLAIVAGIVAGIINTLAGSGSAVTLPMLDLLGLSAPVANATNRVGVVLQNVAGIATFRQQGKLKAADMAGAWWLIGASMVGAIIGTWFATTLGRQQMELAIGLVMILVLITIFYNPNKWLRTVSEVEPGRPNLKTLGIFTVIGAYGGFVQVGVGVFLVAALVLGMGYTLVQSNIIKLVAVLAFTAVALVVFAFSPVEIDWGIGMLMAVGQMIGAWGAALFASKVPNANVWVRRLLIVVVIYSILRYLGILAWVVG